MFRLLGDGGPETMVNTEVWLPAGFSLEYWLSRHEVTSAGPLGSSGRYVVLLTVCYITCCVLFTANCQTWDILQLNGIEECHN